MLNASAPNFCKTLIDPALYRQETVKLVACIYKLALVHVVDWLRFTF